MGTLYYGGNLDILRRHTHKMNQQQYPRLQLRTVRELMDGKRIEHPTAFAALDETFKKAPASKKKHGHQKEFGL